jgi:hypothetical protein
MDENGDQELDREELVRLLADDASSKNVEQAAAAVAKLMGKVDRVQERQDSAVWIALIAMLSCVARVMGIHERTHTLTHTHTYIFAYVSLSHTSPAPQDGNGFVTWDEFSKYLQEMNDKASKKKKKKTQKPK